ncbi:MAG: hypothetical protein H7308_12025 [Chthonomonadaceae bacterium]|nr:hypothetical protein [Chthonomonadaceae bacterium]
MTNQFWQAYLFGWIFWVSLSLGCTGLLFLFHAVRGSWGLPILRVLEAGTKLLPWMGLLFVPIVMNVLMGGDLYPWVHRGSDPILAKKAFWLNPGFFAGRQIFYFLIWSIWATLLTRSAKSQDRDGDLNRQQFRSSFGAWGMVMFILSATLAYTDWVMSLDPHWFSTIFGAWFIMGNSLTAFSFCTIFVASRSLKNKQPWAGANTFSFRKDMGNLMLTLCMIWAYFSLSQFLIIWSGNLPEEITYFTRRFNDPMLLTIGTLLIFCQWMIPLLCLFAPRTKRQTHLLLKVATWIMFVRFFDIFWAVVPFFMVPAHDKANPMRMILEPGFAISCGVATLIFGAVWGIIFGILYKSENALPTFDPRLQDLMEADVHV